MNEEELHAISYTIAGLQEARTRNEPYTVRICDVEPLYSALVKITANWE